MKRVTLILILFSIIINYSFAQTDTVIIEKSNDKVIIGGKAYYVHIVKKGETLFSLSNLYEVTQKEIAKENPEIFLGLQIGQALKIPIRNKLSESDDVSMGFVYHRVKKGQTLYSLTKKYNVSQEDIIACNPTACYGINVDQIVKIPKSKDIVETIKFPIKESLQDTIKINDQYIYHTVQKKETIYSLTRFYEISEDLLLENNPIISEGLKIGQILKIPMVEDMEIASVLIKPDEKLIDSSLLEIRTLIAFSDSIYVPNCEKIIFEQHEPYQVAVLLPFYLEKNDEKYYIDSSATNDYGQKIYEKFSYEPFYVYPNSVAFIEFYEGLLLAIDSLKQKGLSINLHVYDTKNDTARVKEILSYPEFVNMGLIIGPIYNQEVNLVSEFSRENKIKMISPILDNIKLVNENPYLFQVYPSYNSQIDEFAKFVSNFGDKNIVLVHGGDSLGYANIQMVKNKIFNNLSIDTLINNIQFKEVVFQDSINVLEHALDNKKENIFIIPSNEEAFVTDVVTNLNTLKTFGNQLKVVGLNRWQRFNNIDPEYYFNLELCISTPFYINYHDKDVKNFILKYRNIYNTEPDQMSIHAYDVGLYFFSALMYYGKDFENCIYNHNMNLLQADYKFVKWYVDSGFENVNVSMVKYFDDYHIARIQEVKNEIQPYTQSQ